MTRITDETELLDALDEIKWICEEECPRVLSEDSEEAHTLDEKVDEILELVNQVL